MWGFFALVLSETVLVLVLEMSLGSANRSLTMNGYCIPLSNSGHPSTGKAGCVVIWLFGWSAG